MSEIEQQQVSKTPSLRLLGVFLLALMVVLSWRIGWQEQSTPTSHAPPAATPGGTTSIAVPISVPSVPSLGGGPYPTRADLTAATRDPFLLQAIPEPIAVTLPIAAPVVAAPVIQRDPVPSLTFAGRMQTPDGRVVVLARWSDGTPVSLEAEKDLGNGYRVERISEQSVVLLNPQTKAILQLALPSAPRFETR